MAKLMLLPEEGHADAWESYPARRIRESYAADVHRVHQLTKDPQEADVILWASNRGRPPLNLGYWKDPLFRKFWRKTVIYDGNFNPSPLMGGLCPSWLAARPTNTGLGYGWPYYHPASAEPHLEPQPWTPSPAYLWSFCGSKKTHPMREKLFQLNDPMGCTVDTSVSSLPHLSGESSESARREFHQGYIRQLQQSAFVVCPRGEGPSSMRIFEAMRAGRAPVIISDEWSPPPFVDWAACSIRIPEKAIHKLPQIMRDVSCEAFRKGERARQEWEKVFGKGLFHHITEACIMMVEQRLSTSSVHRLIKRLSFVGREDIRDLARALCPLRK
jgi:hypothetical protein